MLLCPQSSGHILSTIHDAAALIIEAENTWYHVRAAFGCLEGGRTFLLIADPACRGSGSGAEPRCHNAGVPLTGLTTAGSK